MSQAVDDVAESMILLPPLVSAAKGAASMRCFFFGGGDFCMAKPFFGLPFLVPPFLSGGGVGEDFMIFRNIFVPTFFCIPRKVTKRCWQQNLLMGNLSKKEI